MDISKYVTIGEDGKATINHELFKSDFDRETRASIDKALANSSAKIKEELKAELEKEAKMSAEEKLQAEKDAFAKEMAEARKELGREKAKNILVDFSEKEQEVLLKLVNDNSAETLAQITELANARKTTIENEQKKFQEQLLEKQPEPKDGGATQPESEGALGAKRYQNRLENGEPKVTAFNNLV